MSVKQYFLRSTLLLLSLNLSGCFVVKNTMQSIPNAENVLITSDQRLIVTGGKGIYEIRKTSNGEVESIPLFHGIGEPNTYHYVAPEKCNFTGIAQYENWLFTTCASFHGFLNLDKNNNLLYADLNSDTLSFSPLWNAKDDCLLQQAYDSLFIANGIARTHDGHLLIADEDFILPSGIAHVQLDYSDTSQPRVVSITPDFISPEKGTRAPNGVRVDGDYLYFSDKNAVKRATIDGFGNIEGNIVEVWKSPLGFPASVIDDLMPFCGGVAFTDFITGQLHYVATIDDDSLADPFVHLYATPPFSYHAPSALAWGEVPGLVSTDQLIVTEKNILFNGDAPQGNKVVTSPLVRGDGSPFDLAAPSVCDEIQQLAREKAGLN